MKTQDEYERKKAEYKDFLGKLGAGDTVAIRGFNLIPGYSLLKISRITAKDAILVRPDDETREVTRFHRDTGFVFSSHYRVEAVTEQVNEAIHTSEINYWARYGVQHELAKLTYPNQVRVRSLIDQLLLEQSNRTEEVPN